MANASYIEARARLSPGSGAEWIDVAGTYAMFDTPESPVTQTFGLGMFGPVAAADLDRIEAFFTERGAPVHHEISPLADPSVWPLITERRYIPFEFTSILYLDLRGTAFPGPDRASGITVRPPTPDEQQLWAGIAAAGWGFPPDTESGLSSIFQTTFTAAGVVPFFAENGAENGSTPIGTGALNLQSGVALLAGASTIPAARNQGAQRALLAARLQFAAEARCDIATMGAQPGSTSQKNAERAGFRIAYTRTKWKIDKTAV